MGSHLILCYTLFVISLISLLAEHHVEAEVYTVGDDNQWDTGTNYLLWSEKYNFSVGDILVFKYVKGQHNVYQVTEETFRSCDSSTGVIKIYDNGNDRVTLTEPAKYWFICNTKGHCQGGMKFGVTAGASNSGGGNSTMTPPSPDFAVQPPPVLENGVAGEGVGWWRSGWVCCLVAFCLLHFV